jgi:hypothetical protein
MFWVFFTEENISKLILISIYCHQWVLNTLNWLRWVKIKHLYIRESLHFWVLVLGLGQMIQKYIIIFNRGNTQFVSWKYAFLTSLLYLQDFTVYIWWHDCFSNVIFNILTNLRDFYPGSVFSMIWWMFYSAKSRGNRNHFLIL